MRKYRKLVVKLSAAQERQISELLGGGVQPVRVIKRAQSLRLLSAGQSVSQVGASVGLTAKAVGEIGRRYLDSGFPAALFDRPRSGCPPRLQDRDKQRIIAMVCSKPPEGRARWTVRLIAEEAVKRKLVRQIGRESVRVLLENHELKPWREKNVVRGRTE
jgi:putative transposase